MNAQIARLSMMADAAEREYHNEYARGGEPAFPQWIADVREVCQLAELVELWDTTHDACRSEALVAMRSHLKKMRSRP